VLVLSPCFYILTNYTLKNLKNHNFLQNAQEKTTPTAGKLAVKIYKMRKIKLAHLKKIKKFISISNKHLRIVDKICVIL